MLRSSCLFTRGCSAGRLPCFTKLKLGDAPLAELLPALCVRLPDSTGCFSFSFAGIAFPTSISVNNCVCHFSPLKSDQDYILKDGDLVKM